MKGPLTSEQISSIFRFHPSIHFVTLITEEGILLDSAKRAGQNPSEPPEEIGKAMERWASVWSTLARSDLFRGKMKTIIVRREKLVDLLFPMSGFMIMITVHPAFPLDKTSQLEKLLSSLYIGGDEWRQDSTFRNP